MRDGIPGTIKQIAMLVSEKTSVESSSLSAFALVTISTHGMAIGDRAGIVTDRGVGTNGSPWRMRLIGSS